MKRTLLLCLLTLFCLCSCSQNRHTPEERIETYLRQISPDQKPVNFLEVDEETASTYLLHSAVYHGLVFGHNPSMTTDEIWQNLYECNDTAAPLLVHLDYAPAVYDEAASLWYPLPHESEYNLFYVVHDAKVNGRYISVKISCIGYDVNTGLYTFSPDGSVQYEEDLLCHFYDDMDTLRARILENPEKYEILTIGLMEENGKLYLSGMQ